MPTPCTTKPLEFEGHESRRVVAAFHGGPITSDAGALLLRQVEQHLSLIDQVADCFHDMPPLDSVSRCLTPALTPCLTPETRKLSFQF